MRSIRIVLMLSLMVFSSFSVYSQDNREAQARRHYLTGKEHYAQDRFKEAQKEFQRALSLISQEEKEPAHPEGVIVSTKERILAQEKRIKATEVLGYTLEYTIDVGDVLNISVWEEKNLNQEVIVRPDGRISFPLAGDVPAAGLTFTQLKEELIQKLKEYIKYPVVSITLKKLGGKKIIVLGEVGWPGVYSVTGKKTILEAVALAGGFTDDAVLSSVILVKGGLQHPQAKRVNLSRAIKRADMSQNVTLEPEDIVYVPKKFIANVNYALEQILGPLSSGSSAFGDIRVFKPEF